MSETSTPESATPTGWRTDPRWRIVSYDENYFTEPPPDTPLPKAELAQPDAWASLYDNDGRAVATWTRLGVVDAIR